VGHIRVVNVKKNSNASHGTLPFKFGWVLQQAYVRSRITFLCAEQYQNTGLGLLLMTVNYLQLYGLGKFISYK
jgi:hypothetical protein